jgi:hypothetical protein
MPSGFNNRPNVSNRLSDALTSQVAGILSTRPSARYASGARTMLKINGKIVGFAFGVGWKIQTATTDINTIDDVYPAELAPQRVTVEGTLNALHIPGISAGTELWQADALNFLFQQYITIEVRDTNDQLMFYTSKALITSRAEDVRVDQLSNVTLTWRAIGFQDERRPEIAEGAQGSSQKGENKNPVSRLTGGVAGTIADKLRNFGF